MNTPFYPSSPHKMLSAMFIGMALLLSIVLGSLEAKRIVNASNYFSPDSLKIMRSLNHEYNMVADDLLGYDDNSRIISELFKANAIITDPVDEANTGLILSLLNEDNEEGLLLLQSSAEMTDEQLNELADLYETYIPEVVEAEIDQEVELMGEPVYLPKGYVRLAEERPEILEPVTIGVIDSGVDITHEIFEGGNMERGFNTFTDDDTMYDDVGHGTHISGIIVSEMPGATIVPYKIVNSKGGRLSNVIEAFNKAIDDDVDIINTSFGLLSSSYSLKKLVEEAYDNGIIVVSAAGNNSSSRGFYPATYDHTIAVASVDRDGNKMPKSNYGDWIDVAADGFRIRSSLPDDSYGYKSGTSQSTAFVTAAIAKIITGAGLDHHMSLKEILDELNTRGEEIKDGELAGITIVK